MENQDKKEESPIWIPSKDFPIWKEINRKANEDFEHFIIFGKYPDGDKRNESLKSTDGEI